MIIWILLLIGMLILQNIAITFSYPPIYVHISTVGMLLCILGMAYQAYAKQQAILRQEAERKRHHELLGQILTGAGYCSPKDILEGLNRQNKGDARKIGEILTDMKVIDQTQLDRALKIQHEIKRGSSGFEENNERPDVSVETA